MPGRAPARDSWAPVVSAASLIVATCAGHAQALWMPTGWRLSGTYDANNVTYMVGYYGGDDDDKNYANGQKLLGQMQRCANVTTPGTADAPLYFGTTGGGGVMLFASRIVGDAVQRCVTAGVTPASTDAAADVLAGAAKTALIVGLGSAIVSLF